MFLLDYEIAFLVFLCERVNEGGGAPAWRWGVKKAFLVETSKCEAGWGTEHSIGGELRKAG